MDSLAILDVPGAKKVQCCQCRWCFWMLIEDVEKKAKEKKSILCRQCYMSPKEH